MPPAKPATKKPEEKKDGAKAKKDAPKAADAKKEAPKTAEAKKETSKPKEVKKDAPKAAPAKKDVPKTTEAKKETKTKEVKKDSKTTEVKKTAAPASKAASSKSSTSKGKTGGKGAVKTPAAPAKPKETRTARRKRIKAEKVAAGVPLRTGPPMSKRKEKKLGLNKKDGKKTTKGTDDKTKRPAVKKVAVEKKAELAKKRVLKGVHEKRQRKVRYNITFKRPNTKRLARSPKYPRFAVPSRNRLDKFSVVKHPLTTESAMKSIEDNNTLVFLVDTKANKRTTSRMQ